MGHNVQSQVGVSLSDVYDVKGGQSPIERLFTNEVPAVHEMGKTIFSERLQGGIRRRTTGAIGQSVLIDEVLDDLARTPFRLEGLLVMTNDSARIGSLAVMIRDDAAANAREMPIWVWDGTNVDVVRFEDAGNLQTFELLTPVPAHSMRPLLMIGVDQPGGPNVSQIAMRGTTSAFGAGTVFATLLLRTNAADQGGISSYGLPIPSW